MDGPDPGMDDVIESVIRCGGSAGYQMGLDDAGQLQLTATDDTPVDPPVKFVFSEQELWNYYVSCTAPSSISRDTVGNMAHVDPDSSRRTCLEGNDSEHEMCHRDQPLRIPRRVSIDVGVTLVIGRMCAGLPRRHGPLRRGRSGVVAQLHPRSRNHSSAATSAPSLEVR